MKVVVDHELCESNALCMEECPEVFLVNDVDQLVLLQERPTAALRGQIEAAVKRCPRQALGIVDP